MARKTSTAQLEASQRYDRANTKRISLKLNLYTDDDILAWLDEQESKQGAIKRLIRDELGRRKASQGVSDDDPAASR